MSNESSIEELECRVNEMEALLSALREPIHNIEVCFDDAQHRIERLEKTILRSQCKTGSPPFDRGCTRFMGDSPGRDPHLESMVGNLWAFGEDVLRLAKNVTKKTLYRGEETTSGIVDVKLRSEDGVPNNDFFWMET